MKSAIKFTDQFKKLADGKYAGSLRKIKNRMGPNYRDLDCAVMYMQGFSLSDIGRSYNFSRERARQIVGRIAERQNSLIEGIEL